MYDVSLWLVQGLSRWKNYTVSSQLTIVPHFQWSCLRASSLQFTSPLEFNAIFRDGFPLRVNLSGWSKIRDPVTAKFKHARLL